MGGMLVGTLIGVLVIPGLYYVFATMAKGRKLIMDERDEPVSEEFVRRDEEGTRYRETIRILTGRMKELLKRKKDE
jgi:HAE1 family hydrophobic/amphiphilic exporter-1